MSGRARRRCARDTSVRSVTNLACRTCLLRGDRFAPAIHIALARGTRPLHRLRRGNTRTGSVAHLACRTCLLRRGNTCTGGVAHLACRTCRLRSDSFASAIHIALACRTWPLRGNACTRGVAHLACRTCRLRLRPHAGAGGVANLSGRTWLRDAFAVHQTLTGRAGRLDRRARTGSVRNLARRTCRTGPLASAGRTADLSGRARRRHAEAGRIADLSGSACRLADRSA